ncbi:MAG: NUDIX hydrolase [Acidobacteria bacterium]|nr:NUDIX hydrolase [Acidobacteriota bacterium]
MKRLIRKIWRKLPGGMRLWAIRMSQPKFTSSAAVVIINESGEVLLLDHVLRPFSGWGLPGGFISHGEQPDEAVRREVSEEVGIELRSLELFRVRCLDRHIEFLYAARPDGEPKVNSPEIIGFGWFRPDDMPEKLSPAQASLIRSVLYDAN